MPTHPNEVIEIHQALHGYSEGHCLLETSRSWPRETERTLLVLSDMSGPSMLPGFESYLTGYALPDVGVYAFAKTWYAAEMERPGCVWTHTLLIDNADLARFRSLHVLLPLFCRPQKERPRATYSSPLTLPSLSPGDVDLQEFSTPPTSSTSVGKNSTVVLNLLQEFSTPPTSSVFSIPPSSLDEVSVRARRSYGMARKIITALYGHPEKPIFVPAESSEHYADIVVAIWGQQWPRLRRSFHFCTGSLSNRSVHGKVFDLQVIPSDLVRTIPREVPQAQFIGLRAETSQSDFPAWAQFAARDLEVRSQKRFPWQDGDKQEGREHLSSEQNTFRQFLWTFGSDMTEGRAAFPRLVEVFLAVHKPLQPSALSVITELVGQHFPKPGDAAHLKKAIFGPRAEKNNRLLSEITEADLLREIITTEQYAMFSSETFNLHDRAKVMWERQREATKNLIGELGGTRLNPLGDDFFSGLAAAITKDDIVEFVERNPETLLTLIRHNVSLAASPELGKPRLSITTSC